MRSFDAVTSSPAELTTDEDEGDQQPYAEGPLSHLSREKRAWQWRPQPLRSRVA